MTPAPPKCQSIQVVAFGGDRSRAFALSFRRKLSDERNGTGPGPPAQECLLYTGHAGLSTDGGTSIFGFSPDVAGIPVWLLLHELRNGMRFRGVVNDDTAVFAEAARRSLPVATFEVVLPDPVFVGLRANLDRERQSSQYYYGFPNGDGDCITWLERLGLPLLTGRMDEFLGLPGRSSLPTRRFGLCV